jgi:hypothetical protein
VRQAVAKQQGKIKRVNQIALLFSNYLPIWYLETLLLGVGWYSDAIIMI